MEKGPANHAQFDDADELAAAFRHVDVEFRCQDCGPFHGSLGFTALQGIEVQHLRLNRTSVSHAFNGQGRFALLVQLHSPKPCVWNGQAMHGPAVMAYGLGAEHAGTQPGGVECAVLSYPHDRVVSLAPDSSGSAALRQLQRGCHQVNVPPVDYGLLTWRVMQLNALASTDPSVLGQPAVREVFESLLEESLLRVLARTAEGAARPATRRHLLEAIRRAEDYLETAPCPSLRLSGICAEAGINASVLRQACFELFGLRVTRYLALFRLVRLRRDLLTSVDGTEDIAVVARRWGFWNLPWLRWRYRRHFAETMELTRTRGFLAQGS